MLQFIRDRAQSWIAIIIVGMLILALGAFAWDSYFRADPVVPAAFVNGEKISAAEFQRSYQSQRARLQEQLGGIDISQFIPDEQKYKQDVLEQLIKEKLIEQSAIEAGYQISDLALGQKIRQFRDFQTDGQFDSEKYEQLLRQYFGSIGAFEDKIRRDSIVQQYRQAVMMTAWLTPQEENYLISKQEQQRDVGFVDIPLSSFSDTIEVSDAEAKEYYEQHTSRYMTPEKVSIEYIELAVPDLMQDVEVDEAALRDLYESRKMDFVVPEERRLRHILVEAGTEEAEADALARAEALLASIKGGKSFEAVAKESSDDFGSATQGGDLGYMGRDAMMDEAFADAAFALSIGDISEPVKSSYGYHIIKLVDIKANQTKAFEEVRAQLEDDYRKQQAEELFYDKGEELANMAFENPDSLEPAAEETGLVIKTTSLFTRDAGPGIATDEKVRDIAFSDDVLIAGNNSEPLELGKERLVVLRVKEHVEVGQRPFDSVKAAVIETVRNEKAQQLANMAGDELMAQVASGGDIEAIAKEKGWEWKALGAIKRSAGVNDRDVVSYAFKMPHPAADQVEYRGFSRQLGGYAVVALYSVKDGDAESVDEAQKQSLVQSRLRALRIADIIAAMDYLRDSASVTVFPENL